MSKKLLVTDDALIIREIIKETAQQAGWQIVGEASNGQEAINQYKELRPHAVTLDLVMPEYGGLHALDGILDFDPAAKVIVVSALEQKSVLKDAFKRGATDFIVKPFDRSHLIATLETACVAAAATA